MTTSIHVDKSSEVIKAPPVPPSHPNANAHADTGELLNAPLTHDLMCVSATWLITILKEDYA